MSSPIHSVVFHDSNCYEAKDFSRLEEVEEFEVNELEQEGGRFHLLIGRNGRIMRSFDDQSKADELDIFVMGDFTHRPPTQLQMNTLKRLFDWFEYKFDWRVEPDSCHPHYAVSDDTDECPGGEFPLQEFERECAERLDDPEQTPFHEYEERKERRESLNKCKREIKRINGDIEKNIEKFDSVTEEIEQLIENEAA